MKTIILLPKWNEPSIGDRCSQRGHSHNYHGTWYYHRWKIESYF
ncbi:MAG: hypothetical protein Q9M36_02690 [Sulfurovum sp.]|nr:hypothetical protein [Sulfurovum sp.]